MQVVLTRSSSEGRAFGLALGDRVDVVYMPVTAIVVTAEDITRLESALSQPKYDRWFVASRHAVSPLVQSLVAVGRSPADAPPVAAVGPATTAALRGAGFSVEQLGDHGDAAASALVARGVAGERILAPRAAGGRDGPLAQLRAAGASVTALDCYQTRDLTTGDRDTWAGKAALSSGSAAACGLFAPSQVSALAQILGPQAFLNVMARVAIFAIGPTTAAAVRAAGLSAAGIADSPTPAAMAAAFAKVYPLA